MTFSIFMCMICLYNLHKKIMHIKIEKVRRCVCRWLGALLSVACGMHRYGVEIFKTNQHSQNKISLKVIGFTYKPKQIESRFRFDLRRNENKDFETFTDFSCPADWGKTKSVREVKLKKVWVLHTKQNKLKFGFALISDETKIKILKLSLILAAPPIGAKPKE